MQSVRTTTPVTLQDLQSWYPQFPYSFHPTAAARDTGTHPLLLTELGAVWSMAPRFVSTRALTCRTTAASTSTMVRVRASAALLPSCTLPCSPCPSFWTLGAWRTGLAVLGPMLSGKSGRPTQSLSSWGQGLLWTGHPACSTTALLLTATQAFVCTAKHYSTVRVGVSFVITHWQPFFFL